MANILKQKFKLGDLVRLKTPSGHFKSGWRGYVVQARISKGRGNVIEYDTCPKWPPSQEKDNLNQVGFSQDMLIKAKDST